MESKDTPFSETDEEVAIVKGDAPDATESAIGSLMARNFVEYASYVIRERAIPDMRDGLKPVQRRILHSLYEIDDGRFHKVANVIGHTMQYHPHGDASIYDALVVLANKAYFIDKQGNFGNIYTGDAASAARYIECRLTPLARDVMFNPEVTEMLDSYDGRNKEPLHFPCKIPALLLLGADGIAVGMSTRLLPHNFNEVLEAQIAQLRGQPFKLYPDFLTGGNMDVSDYEDGLGRVKVRATIEIVNDKTLSIREIPATTSTESLIASIEDAARKNKIKISSVSDYTAEEVEIEIKLARGAHAKDTIKRLFAHTDCEVGIQANPTVILDETPTSVCVSEVIQLASEQLLRILKQELEIELSKLLEKHLEKTLAQIFVEERIYKRIEECEKYDAILAQVYEGLKEHVGELYRGITDEDIEKLLRIHIRRISLFDINRNQRELRDILSQIETVKYSLEHLTDYAIDYLQDLLARYGELYPRMTEIEELETIRAADVALENVKVGHDRTNGFIGTQVKSSGKNETPLTCTEYDRLVLMQNTGAFQVIKIPEKRYVGNIKYLFKADKDKVYAVIYRDKKTGKHYAKRVKIDKFYLDKAYCLMPKNCFLEKMYFSDDVYVKCEFKHQRTGQESSMLLDFGDVELRSRAARGVKIADRLISRFSVVERTTSIEHDEADNHDSGDAEEPLPKESEESADKTVREPTIPESNTEQSASKQQKTQQQKKEKNADQAGSPENKEKDRNVTPADDNSGATESTDSPRSALLIDEDTPFFLE